VWRTVSGALSPQEQSSTCPSELERQEGLSPEERRAEEEAKKAAEGKGQRALIVCALIAFSAAGYVFYVISDHLQAVKGNTDIQVYVPAGLAALIVFVFTYLGLNLLPFFG